MEICLLLNAFLHTAIFIQSQYVIRGKGETVNITVGKVGEGNFSIQVNITFLSNTTSMLVVVCNYVYIIMNIVEMHKFWQLTVLYKLYN